MNGYELECFIKSNQCVQHTVKGIFARTNLPTGRMEYPSAYIVNSDDDNGPGEHWLTIVLKSRAHGIFFDSFGRPPDFYGAELKHFLNCNVDSYEYFGVQIQPKHSSRCGFFVLTFLLLNVCLNYSLDSVSKFFSSDVNENDSIVFNFVNKYYGVC